MSDTTAEGFRLERRGDLSIVRLEGPKIPPELAAPLYRLVDEEGPRRVVLDLSAVRYISSNGIGILVSLHKRLVAASGRMVVCGIDPDVLALLKLTNVDRLIAAYPTEEE